MRARRRRAVWCWGVVGSAQAVKLGVPGRPGDACTRRTRSLAPDPRRMGAPWRHARSSTASASPAAADARARRRAGTPGARHPAARRRAATCRARGRAVAGASRSTASMILPTSSRRDRRRAARRAGRSCTVPRRLPIDDEPSCRQPDGRNAPIRARGCRATPTSSEPHAAGPPSARIDDRSHRSRRTPAAAAPAPRIRSARSHARHRAQSAGAIQPQGRRGEPAAPISLARTPISSPARSSRTSRTARTPSASFMSEIDRFRPDDRRGVDTLYRRTHGADAAEATACAGTGSTAAIRTTPAGQPGIWVAREGPTVVGHYPTLPVRLSLKGLEVEGAWGTDAMVAPERDRQGLGEALRARVGSQQRRGAGARARRDVARSCSTACTGRESHVVPVPREAADAARRAAAALADAAQPAGLGAHATARAGRGALAAAARRVRADPPVRLVVHGAVGTAGAEVRPRGAPRRAPT